MQALAIRSPSIINNLSTAISPCLPIGLAYIVGAIEDLVDIEVIDPIAEKPRIADVTPYMNGTSIMGLLPDEVIFRIKKTPNLILISSMFSMEWPITAELIDKLKAKFPSSIIVGGGEHFSAAAEYSLKHSKLDVCVVGEGEVTIREFVQQLRETNKLPTDISGTVVKTSNNQIINNEKRPRVRKIESIQKPAWEHFNVDGFLESGVSNTGNGLKGFRAMPINASRGCPYQCTFCSNPDMWGNLWRARPPQDVVGEMQSLIERYQITHFDFCDLTAIVKKEWILEFCQILIDRNLGITWGLPSGTRSEALDTPVLEMLQKSGCNDLDYAPESGSETILKIMKKKIKKQNMLRSMKQASKVGITTKANIIFGYPEERRWHVLETFWFIIQMAWVGIDDLICTSLSVYPGSKVFKQLTEDGTVHMNREFFLNLSSQGSLNRSPNYSHYYSQSELHFFKVSGMGLFYLSSMLFRPVRALNLIIDLVRGQGRTRLSMGLLNLMRRHVSSFGKAELEQSHMNAG